MQEFNMSLGAGENSDLYAEGRFIRVVASPYPVKVRVTATSEDATLSQGQSIQFEKDTHGHLNISNTGSATAQVTLLIGNGTFVDNAVSGDINSTKVQASTVTDAQVPLTAATAAQLFASDGTRKAARIYNPLTDILWIGGEANITVGEGWPIPAGGSWTEDDGAPAAWYGVSNAAGTVNTVALT